MTSWRFCWWESLGRGSATGDAITNKVIITDTNGSVGRRNDAFGVLVTNEIDTHVLGDTFQRTPLDRDRVFHVECIRENCIIAIATSTFEFLGRVMINTE